MWFQHVIASMEADLSGSEVMGAALQPIFYMMEESSDEEFRHILFPLIKKLISVPRSVQVRIHLLSPNGVGASTLNPTKLFWNLVLIDWLFVANPFVYRLLTYDLSLSCSSFRPHPNPLLLTVHMMNIRQHEIQWISWRFVPDVNRIPRHIISMTLILMYHDVMNGAESGNSKSVGEHGYISPEDDDRRSKKWSASDVIFITWLFHASNSG